MIENYSQLVHDDLEENLRRLRKIGLTSLKKALNSVKPSNLIESSIMSKDRKIIIEEDEYDVTHFENVYIIGGGKATKEMALALEKFLLNNFKDVTYKGMINIPEGLESTDYSLSENITINYASHPIPSNNGQQGVKRMIEMIKNATERDLIVCLISGGGSALLPLPKNGLTLQELQKINEMLLASGASIHEINTIRKHLSDFKGGNLAKTIHETSGATLVSLIISDVVGDNLDVIASGPTVPDLTTYLDSVKILRKYGILEKIPVQARKIIEEGLEDPKQETPKPEDSCFENTHNYLIGSVKSAAYAVIDFLNSEGFETDYFSNEITGEAREYGKILSDLIQQRAIDSEVKNLALVGTGELTVTIKGNGIGGRNQEMLLSFVDKALKNSFDYEFVIIGVNLDGIEGNSKAMGALIDNSTLAKVQQRNINPQTYLDKNDSNSFFKEVSTEIITGPTGINVNDMIICLLNFV